MLGGLALRGIQPDAITFADTGGELPETYAYIPILSFWLEVVGFPPLTIVKNHSPRAHDASLYDEMLRKSVLPSISYGRHSCAEKWKIRPQERWRKSWPLAQEAWAAGRKVVVAIGYDDGPGDSRRMCKAFSKETLKPSSKYRYWYPLQDWGWDRSQCVEMITSQMKLPVRVKSSCFFCAARKKSEIEALRQSHPALFEAALEMERRALPKLRTVKGLGRRFAWQDLSDPSQPEEKVA
jgi:hypothetical protein